MICHRTMYSDSCRGTRAHMRVQDLEGCMASAHGQVSMPWHVGRPTRADWHTCRMGQTRRIRCVCTMYECAVAEMLCNTEDTKAGMTGAEPTVARLGTGFTVHFTLTSDTHPLRMICLAISTPVGRIGGPSLEGCQDTRLLCGDVEGSKRCLDLANTNYLC